jgi:hypothetical protein
MDKYLYHSANYKRPYNDDAFYNKIIVRVEKKMNRRMRDPEISETVSFIKNLDPGVLAPEYKDKTINIMVNTLASEFEKYDCTKSDYVDSQQILREKIGVSSESGTGHGIYDDPNFYNNVSQTNLSEPVDSFAGPDIPNAKTEVVVSQPAAPTKSREQLDLQNLLGMRTSEEAVRVLNPAALHRKNYLMLDSRYRILTSNDTNGIQQFSWNYILKSQIEGQGSVNIIGNVRDIIAIRVYPFRIPYVESADNKYSRVSVFIEELAAQSFLAHEDRKFHFMLKSEIDSDFINLETDKYNDGFFHFEKPITTLNTLTISFGSPLEKITFENDRGWCGIDYFSLAPLTLITTYDSNAIPSTTLNHNLTNGDRVYFELFNAGAINPLLVQQVKINDNIISGMNKTDGFLITVVNPTQFSIAFDTSLIQNPTSEIRFRVFFGSKRIFLPIELTYIMPQIDSDDYA